MQLHSGIDQWRFRKFILCLNVLFGINVYLTLVYSVLGLRVPGHTIITSLGPLAVYAAMIGLGAKELRDVRYYSEILKRRDVVFAIRAYFTICVIMAVQLPLNLAASGSALIVLDGILTWMLPVVAVFGVQETNWHTVGSTLRWHTAIGCFCLLCAMPVILAEVRPSNPLTERLSLVEVAGGTLYYGSQLIYAGTFLVLSFRSLTLPWRLTALTTLGLSMWMSIIGQFRSGVALLLAVAALGLIYIPVRVRATRRRNVASVVIAASLLVLFSWLDIGSFSSITERLMAPLPIVSEYVEALVKRNVLTSSQSGLPHGFDDRLQESQEALAELNVVQLIFGKGAGATWSGGTMYEGRRNMLHFWLGQLMLHGGVLLALFVILGPASMALYGFLASRSELSLVCASTLCLALAGAFVSNIFAPSLGYVLLSLCVGGSLLHLQKR